MAGKPNSDEQNNSNGHQVPAMINSNQIKVIK